MIVQDEELLDERQENLTSEEKEYLHQFFKLQKESWEKDFKKDLY